MKYKTREEWLGAAVELLRPMYKDHGKLPAKLAPIVSWPKGSAKAIGQFFPKAWAKDAKTNYIHIVPTIADPVRVLDIIVHEMIHALEVDKGHGANFKKIALALGLEGKMRATVAGEELKKKLIPLAKKLGIYPHTQMIDIKPLKAPSAKKTVVRFVSPVNKAYSVWLSPKQAELVGPPVCPISNKPMEEV